MNDLENKIARILEFGMTEKELSDPDSGIEMWKAHFRHMQSTLDSLKYKADVLETALDYIASSLSSEEESRELALRALELTQVRKWRGDE